MDDIKRTADGEDNWGGMYPKIYFIPLVLVGSIPEPDPENSFKVNASGIEITEGNWNTFECTPETGIFTEDSKETDDGTKYTYKLEAVSPKNTADKWNSITEHQQYEHLVVARDLNGETFLIGTMNGEEFHGMILETKTTSGKKTSERNSVTLSFSFDTYTRAVPVVFDEDAILAPES